MANLGTLWFGADIDLTALRQKIQSGNQSILNALKMDYDPASYQQMVSNLKSRLASETFEIKIQANSQQIAQQLQQTVSSISNSSVAPNINLNGLKGIHGMTNEILNQRDAILDNKKAVQLYKEEWGRAINQFGRRSAQAMSAYGVYDKARTDLRKANWELESMNITKGRASLQQKILNEQMKEAQKTAKQWNSDHMRLNATLAGGIHVSTQLGSALSSLFAIDYARQFLGNVIEIGGQLEKQRISIAAILGDTVKANHLFEQIKGLALKSPFGVVELDQYTKQLSAYGFKYNELFDMTKRLADISAGAGTDIGRLTLALGHVRSATYLTGITLRQFSMNNIPMLKMLADYYTEVEKKAVSTAEVQKRISKRQVSYEDVIEQIRRLTDEGGMFYNMQEKISESLAAKFKNLKDAMDIMYGEMAEGTVGDMLKGLASSLLQLTRHWKEIASVMAVAAGAFLVNKTAIGLTTITTQGNSAATIKQIMVTKQLEANNLLAASSYRKLTLEELRKVASAKTLTAQDISLAMATKQLTKDEVLNAIALEQVSIAESQALVKMGLLTKAEVDQALATSGLAVRMKSLGYSIKSAFAGIGWGTWATIGAMAGMELYMAWDQWNQRIDDKAKEMKDLIKSRIVDLEKVQKEIDKEGKPTDNTALKSRVDEMKQVLANSEEYTKTLDEQLTKAGDLSKQYDILAGTIDKIAEKNKKKEDWQDRVAEMIKASTGDFSSMSIQENLDWLFNQDINKNMSQTLDAYKELRKTIDAMWEYKNAMKEVIDEMMNMDSISDDFKNQIKDAPFEEQLRLIAESPYWKIFETEMISMNYNFVDVIDKLTGSANKVTERWEEIATDDIPRMMSVLLKNFDNDEKKLKEWALNNIDDFKMMLDGINDQLDLKEPAIRKKLNRMVFSYVTLGKVQNDIPFDYAKALGAITKEEEKAEIKEPGGDNNPTNTNKTDNQLKKWREEFNELKAFYQEYRKWAKEIGKDEALKTLQNSGLWGQFFKEDGSLVYDINNWEKAIEQFEKKLKGGTEERDKLLFDVGKEKLTPQFDRAKEMADAILKQLDEALKEQGKKWDLYKKILDATGDKSQASTIAFGGGIQFGNFAEQLRSEIADALKGTKAEGVSIDELLGMDENKLREDYDIFGAIVVKLKELKDVEQKLKAEDVELFLAAIKNAKSLETELAQIKLKYEQAREAIKKQGGDQNLIDNTYKNQKSDEAKAQWEWFKKTNEDWGRIFSNLDNISTRTLENMRDELEKQIPLVNDNVESVKALYEALDKLNDKLADRNPFKAMGDALTKSTAIKGLLNEIKDWDNFGSIYINEEKSKKTGIRGGWRNVGEVKKEGEDGQSDAEKDFGKGLEGLVTKFKAVQDALGPVITLFDTLGEEGLSKFFSMGSNALGAAASMGQGAASLFGAAAGPWGAAAGAALSLVSSIAAMHDESLQKEIEASQARQKEMGNLTKNLEKSLERTLGGIYGLRASDSMLSSLDNGGRRKIETILGDVYYADYRSDETEKAIENAKKSKTYYDATYASLLAQRDELQHQMQTEQDKKNSDSDKIADYKQQLSEMKDEIDNFAKDLAKELYDIDVKSWASELGDALFEAWQKGEDGAEAFKKKASDLMADLAKNIAVTKLIETAMQPILDTIVNEMERTKGQFDEKSVNAISEQMALIGGTLPDAFNNLMDGLNEGIKKAGLTDLKELDTDTSSSSTSSSIKGITEQTADILASYVNGIRADLSVMRVEQGVHLPAITAAIQHTSAMADIQVTNLQQIAANTLRNADAADRIYDLLHHLAPDGTKWRGL